MPKPKKDSGQNIPIDSKTRIVPVRPRNADKVFIAAAGGGCIPRMDGDADAIAIEATMRHRCSANTLLVDDDITAISLRILLNVGFTVPPGSTASRLVRSADKI